MKCIVIAPHPDDELLGVGGTLLRRKSEGADVAWMIVTQISEADGWTPAQVARLSEEVKMAAKFFGFSQEFHLGFPAAKLDRVAIGSLVQRMSDVFKSYQPEDAFVPHRSDVHTDHRIVFDAAAGCSKWFRYPSVRRFFCV
jgi:LmbE family N-acetylglucosaminyl deacetylase